MDRAMPNLPSRDLATTLDFYAGFSFVERYRDEAWMILSRGTLTLEFFTIANSSRRQATSSARCASPTSTNCGGRCTRRGSVSPAKASRGCTVRASRSRVCASATRSIPTEPSRPSSRSPVDEDLAGDA